MTKREERILKKYAGMTEQELLAAKQQVSQTRRELMVVEKYMSKTRNSEAALYDAQNKTLSAFIEHMGDEAIAECTTRFVYVYYWYFCMMRNEEMLSLIEFSRRMVKYFGWKIVDRKLNAVKYRVFRL